MTGDGPEWPVRHLARLGAALPDQLVRARPLLSVGYAWALLAGGELEAAEARLQDAERWLDTTADAAERPAAGPAEMAVAEDEELRAPPATIASARASGRRRSATSPPTWSTHVARSSYCLRTTTSGAAARPRC